MQGFKRFTPLFWIGLTFLMSCTVGPRYEPPSPSLPTAYSTGSEESPFEPILLKEWWTSFDDGDLNTLIEKGISENFDLKIAVERVLQARYRFQMVASNLWPKVDLEGSAQRLRTSQTLFDTPFTGPPVQNLFRIGFDSSWEIDLFGKRKREKEAALCAMQAQQEAARELYLTLLSEIATHYIDLRGIQNEIELTKKGIETYEGMIRGLANWIGVGGGSLR